MQNIVLAVFLAVGCCANSLVSAAITAPYGNDFSSSVADFAPTTNGQWALVSGKYQNVILDSLLNKSSSSLIKFDDLGGPALTAQDFSLSTSFTISNSVGDFNSFGFALLANNADATTNTTSFYLADIYKGGGSLNAQLRFAEIGLTPTLTTSVFDLGKVLLLNTAYMLQVEGTYADNGDLTLGLELIDGSDVDSFETTIPAANVLTGQHFGFRDRASGGATSALTVEYDSINITAIPEPSSIGFVATSLIAGYAAGMYMRRRMAKKS